jgi:Flp pilus assembly pilin Flp
MLAIMKFLIEDESAAAAIEYAILLGFIALVAFFALHNVGRAIDRIFDAVRASMPRR